MRSLVKTPAHRLLGWVC